jgi:hypothetical protein
LGELALLADDPTDSLELGAERLIGTDDVVQPVRDLACHAGPMEWHPRGEIAGPHVVQDTQQHIWLESLDFGNRIWRHGPRRSRIVDMASN